MSQPEVVSESTLQNPPQEAKKQLSPLRKAQIDNPNPRYQLGRALAMGIRIYSFCQVNTAPLESVIVRTTCSPQALAIFVSKVEGAIVDLGRRTRVSNKDKKKLIDAHIRYYREALTKAGNWNTRTLTVADKLSLWQGYNDERRVLAYKLD